MPIICKALPVFRRVVAISPSQIAIVWRQVASHKLCNFVQLPLLKAVRQSLRMLHAQHLGNQVVTAATFIRSVGAK